MDSKIYRAGISVFLSALFSACAASQDDASAVAAAQPAHGTRARRPEARVVAKPQADTSATGNCPDGEQLLFACRIASSDKTVSLCTRGGDAAQTTYRFGTSTRNELTYGGAQSAGTGFHRSSLTFAGATGGYAYSFRNGRSTYALYSISGNDDLSRAGIAVIDAGGKKLGDLQCDESSLRETDSIDLITSTRKWTADPVVTKVVR